MSPNHLLCFAGLMVWRHFDKAQFGTQFVTWHFVKQQPNVQPCLFGKHDNKLHQIHKLLPNQAPWMFDKHGPKQRLQPQT